MRIATLLTVIALGFAALNAAPIPAKDNGPANDTLRLAVDALQEVNGDDTEIRARIWLWCDVADLRRKLGDIDGSRDALIKARSRAAMLKQERSGVYWWIGQRYARLGDANAVTELAASLADEAGAASILEISAWAATEFGHAQVARQIVDALANEKERERLRADVRRQLIVYRTMTGNVAGAIRAAEALPTASERVSALVGTDSLGLMYDDRDFFWSRGIATVQLQAGDRVGAKETALKALAALPDVAAVRRDPAMLAVVRFLAKLDDLPAARKALEQLSPKPKAGDSEVEHTRNLTTMTAKGYLAAAEVRAGRDDAAKAIAVDYTNPGGALAEVHLFIGIAQARAGRKEAAQETFTNVVKLRDLHGAGNPSWYSIVSAQAAAGDLAGAVKSAERDTFVPTWSLVIEAQAQAGQFEAARKTIVQRLTEEPLSRCIAEQLVARKQAQAGQAEPVWTRAEKEKDQLLKAAILVGLAEGMYKELPKAPIKKSSGQFPNFET